MPTTIIRRFCPSARPCAPTDELVPQALSNYRPTLTGSASYGRQWTNSNNNPLGGKGTNTSNPLSAGVTLQQPLFRGGRTVAQTQQAENTVLATRAQLLSTEQTVLFNAATAYLNVLRDQAVLDLNVNNEQVLRRQLQATRDRFNVGEVTRTDVSQAEASLATATAGRVAAEGTLAASRANFVNAIGVMPENLTFPNKPLELPKSVQEATSTAAERNPNVIAALYTERAARYGVDLVTGELLPTVSLNGTFARNTNSISGSSTLNRDNSLNSASITAQLSMPLYEAGSITSRVRAAKQTVSQRRQDVLTQRRLAVRERDQRLQQPAVDARPDRLVQCGRALEHHCPRRRAPGELGRPAHRARRARCRAGALAIAGQFGVGPA